MGGYSVIEAENKYEARKIFHNTFSWDDITKQADPSPDIVSCEETNETP